MVGDIAGPCRLNRLRKNSLGTPELRRSAHEGKQEYST